MPRAHRGSRSKSSRELAELRVRLADSEATLRAISTGEVDSVVVPGKRGPQVFTLQGAERAYRVLIESMNEGALTLTPEKTILYANQCFARMVKSPLEQVIGSSLRRFLSAEDRLTLRHLVKRTRNSGSKIQVALMAGDGSHLPVQISIRRLANDGFNGATINMVVTDMTDARRNEEMLRALTHRVVQVQEAERRRIALELHDNVTQLLCAVLFRGQALVDKLSTRDLSAKREAMKLRQLLGETAEEVERISRDLRPSVLEQLGLVAAIRATSTEFAKRSGVSIKLSCDELGVPLPGDTELALYRILQEALRNITKHAHARHVIVRLKLQDTFVALGIADDGIGFDVDYSRTRRKRKGGLGLLGMRERATSVCGTLKIKSVRHTGTEIDARIPLPPKAAVVR